MTTTIKYGNSTIATAENQTKTLLTANKYVGNNIEITDVSSDGGGYTVDEIAMRTISGDISGSATSILGYAFNFCSTLTTASFPNVTTISGYAFNSCYSLTTISFPNATSIGNYAFASCSALTTPSFPKVKTISGYAFTYCSSLIIADFPSATSIGNYAFASCPTLTTASFPNAISMSNYVFYRCYNLLSVYLLGSSVPTLGTSVFNSTPIGGYTTSTGGVYGSIFVLSSLYNSYLTATNWSVYSSRIVSV